MGLTAKEKTMDQSIGANFADYNTQVSKLPTGSMFLISLEVSPECAIVNNNNALLVMVVGIKHEGIRYPKQVNITHCFKPYEPLEDSLKAIEGLLKLARTTDLMAV
jgi:hypothetical protein